MLEFIRRRIDRRAGCGIMARIRPNFPTVAGAPITREWLAMKLAKLGCCLIPLALLATASAQAELVRKTIDYRDGDARLQGYLVYDADIEGKRPGVLVAHEWWGLNDYARQRADQLAEMGYVAFALDMYGRGVRAKTRDEAAQLSGNFKGKPIIRTRARAGLDVLLGQPTVDPRRVAAIGFCFGGTTVLELAYSGADLAGIVSFHGGLVNPKPEDLPRVKASILALHGADDPFVPPAQVDSFERALRDSNIDWQLVIYGGAVHAFTNPAAGTDKSSGAAYNERAARRSWRQMQLFFQEIFATNQPPEASRGERGAP
jgi:dienelactone hydrolase